MALKKEKKLNKMSVTSSGIIELLYTISVIEEKTGEVVSSNNHRNTLIPGADVSEELEEVQKFAEFVWR